MPALYGPPYETHLGSWIRPTTFFWAALGATFGLANVWQFPYLASQHGGGLFVVLYLACLLLVTLPLMVTEATMGRYARHGLVLAMDGFVRRARCSRGWLWAGRLGILAAFLVLSFTTVFGAISLAYVFFGAMGRFLDAGPSDASAILAALVLEPEHYRSFMAWHGCFLLLVVWVSMQGVVHGLERATRAVTPTMILLVAAFFAVGVWQGDFARAANQLLSFNSAALTWQSLESALFHAFFTLGLGLGVWTLFGAYTPAGTRLKRSVLAVVLMDTLVAIVAGLAIFSLVPGGPEVASERGFNLLFLALPVAISDLPGSQFLLAAIYLLMVMVVWSTSLALLEPVVGWLREWTGAPRPLSVFIVAVGVWLVGLGSLWSFNIWSDLQFGGGTFFRWVELLSGGLLVPLVSVLIAIFAGWHLTRTLALKVLGDTPRLFSRIWFWVMRLVLPVVVAYIGLQHSWSGAMAMCGRSSDAIWCHADWQKPAITRSDDKPAGSPEGDASKKAHSTTEQTDSPPTEPSPSSGEETDKGPAPDSDDVLYQST